MEKVNYGMGSGRRVENADLKNLKTRVQQMVASSSLKEISDMIMEEAKKLTSSESCYIAYVDPDNKDSVGISFSHMTNECQMYADMGEARFKIRKDGSYGGLLGYSLDTGESFFIHNPEFHHAAHGLPKGHVPVREFLSVPVKHENTIIGQIVLGNPENLYSTEDVDITDTIADIYSIAVYKHLYENK